jgi:hypothetical protein
VPPRRAGALSRCGRAPIRASAPSTRPSPPTAISRAPPRHPELPTLAALGSHPRPHCRAPEKKKKWGREEKEEPFEGATMAPPRRPEAAHGVPGCREAQYLDATPPPLPLPASLSSSSPRQAFLHRHLHLLVAQTIGKHILIPSSCGAWPSSQGRSHPSAPCRVAAVPSCCVMLAFEPGWEAISCRCCCRLHRARNPLAVPYLVFPV